MAELSTKKKSNQANAEVVMSNFRKSVNDGSIYVITKIGDEIVGVDKVAYISGAEYNELASIAHRNRAKYDLEKLAKHNAEVEEQKAKLDKIANEYQSMIAEQKAINAKLVSILKAMYGVQEADIGILLNELDSEVNE